MLSTLTTPNEETLKGLIKSGTDFLFAGSEGSTSKEKVAHAARRNLEDRLGTMFYGICTIAINNKEGKVICTFIIRGKISTFTLCFGSQA